MSTNYQSRIVGRTKSTEIVALELTSNENSATQVRTSVNHVFCCDISGSMYSTLPKMRQQLKNRIVDLVHEDDTITIIVFADANRCTILKELVSVKDAKDLQLLYAAIDRFMVAGGLTCFYDPAVITKNLINNYGSSDLWSWIFLSDGGNNDCPWSKVIGELTELGDKLNSATIIEYGYWADTKALSEMAEVLGGTKILAEDFNQYEPIFEKVLKNTETSPRILLDISAIKPYLKYQQVFGVDRARESVVVISTARTNQVLIPANLTEVYAVVKPGDEPFDELSMEYEGVAAAIVPQLDAMRYDLVEELLMHLGDPELISQYVQAYGKQRLFLFRETLINKIMNKDERKFQADAPSVVSNNSRKYCLLDLIYDLKKDNILIDIKHLIENYNPIGVKSMPNTILTEDYKKMLANARSYEEAADLLADARDDQPIMTYNYDEIERVKINDLTWNEDRANLSILVKVPVTIELPTNSVGLTKVKSFVWRNYAVIKDGILNVPVLKVCLTKKQADKFWTNISVEKEYEDGSIDGLIALAAYPLINRQRAIKVKSTEMADTYLQLMELRNRQKYLGYLISGCPSPTSSATYPAPASGHYTKEQWDYLNSLGITANGYNPKVHNEKSGEFYMAPTFKIKVAKFSSIPKIEAVLKKREDGKSMTASEAYLNDVMKSVDEGFKQIPMDEYGDVVRAEYNKTKKLISELLESLATSKFTLMLSRKWFLDKKGFDDNTLTDYSYGDNSFDITFEFQETTQYL